MTLATITFQNYFRLYDKLAGMTGTAMTEAEEFHKIYKLEVVAIPTHRPMIRDDEADLVFRNEKAQVQRRHRRDRRDAGGRPAGPRRHGLGREVRDPRRRCSSGAGIKHEVLNAKFHEKESGIVAQAGRTGAVTIATNMAGRGTDILLGGNPAGLASEILHKRGLNPAEVDKATYDAALAEAKAITDEDHERVVAAGGLHIIGTERHDSRRIDNQLRGRAGRQGDPGSSRFYLSLEDDLMKRFASDRVAGLMERLGLEDDVAIESRLVSKTIESAQSRVEGFNFDIRKRVVEFDDVINRQRETIYAERDKVLRNEDLTETVRTFLDEEIDGARRRPPRPATPPTTGAWRRSPPRSRRWASTATGHDRGRALGARQPRRDPRAPPRRSPTAGSRPREAEVGEADWATVERFVLLRTIDSLWVEHLTEIDDMRRGIGLRGYAQQDPLNEFRQGGVPALRGAARPHPPPGRDDDLPGHRHPPAAARRVGARQSLAAGAGPLAAAGARPPVAAPRPRRSGASADVAPAAAGAAARPVGPVVGGGLPRDPMAGARLRVERQRRRRAGRPGASRASRRPAPGSAATTRAGAARARSTRSATAADAGRVASPVRRRTSAERDPRPRPARRSPAIVGAVLVAGYDDVPDLGRRATATSSGRPTRSSSSARPSTTAGRRRLRGPPRPRRRPVRGGRRADASS